MKENILIVEDDVTLQKNLEYILTKEGYQVRCCSKGETALEVVRVDPPDLMLLDLMLPGMDGFDVCKSLKQIPGSENIFIIMLSGKGETEHIFEGLNSYADDYITKPFEPLLLIARINAILRRKQKLPEKSVKRHEIRIGSLRVRQDSREVQFEEQAINLTKSEFDLLLLFTQNLNIVLSRSMILQHIRNDEYDVEERMVDFLVAKLRKKFPSEFNHIETIRGVGYIFKD